MTRQVSGGQIGWHVSKMLLIVLLVTGVAGPVIAVAGEHDWPQWRGPQRDGHAADQMLLQSWPEGGPKLTWQQEKLGRGYSSVAIADGRLFTMGSDDQDCFAICLDSETGKSIWKTKISRAGVGGDYNGGWGAGGRSTPTVDGDQVFVLSDVGVLAALKRDTGSLLWSADLVADYGGSIPKWGYSESVLVDGQRVVVTPGGSKFMIALDRQTGRLLWNSRGVIDGPQYVSVMKGQLGSTTFYVTASKNGLVAFDCERGEQVFSSSATGNDVAVIPTPILTGNLLYHTSDYGAGNVLLKLSASSGGIDAEQIYHLQGKSMMNHHGGLVLVDGTIYGFTKANGGMWMAQNLESGDTLWQERIGRNKSGSISYADGRLYCFNDKDGSVILAEPNPTAWKPRGQLTLPQQTKLDRGKGAIWAHPVIADHTLYVRDQDLMFAYDIRR